MPSTFSPSLRVELIANGEQTDTWGTTTNTNLGTLIEQAIAGVLTLPMGDADKTLTVLNGASDEARNAAIVCTGALTAERTVTIPSATKLYVIRNATTGGFNIRVKTAAAAGVLVPAGAMYSLVCDSVNVYAVGTAGGVTSFNGRSGAVSLTTSDVQLALGFNPAPRDSPAFTGTPTAPTAAPGTSSAQLATCAFVTDALTASIAGVSSFNSRTGSVVLTNADVVAALGYVPLNTTTSISAGVGLTGGGDLSASRTLAVVPDTTVQRTEFFLNGAAVGTRRGINFVSGSGATVTAADNSANGRVDVTVALAAGGVSSFNTRSGAVVLSLSDVTNALGYVPYNSSNPSGFITSAGAPVQSVFGRTGSVTLTASDMNTAVGGTVWSSVNSFTMSGANATFPGTVFAQEVTYLSDARLKKHVAAINYDRAERFVRDVSGVTFLMREKEGMGFIAQRVQEHAPELITEDKDGYLTLNYGAITALHQQVLKKLVQKVFGDGAPEANV